MEIAVGMHQHQGKREYQQDAMSIKHFGSIGVLAILADGMGGYEGGEIASKIISENFREFTIEGDDIGASLKKYLLKGNEAITDHKENHPEVKSMGTTAISFFMADKICQWVSVGDSPLYIIKNRKTISRINENHSVGGLLELQVKKGEITQEEALSSGQRHMLTSAVSGENIPQIDLSVPYSIKDNDIFILASDGIETISKDRIKEIVLGHMPTITQENAQNACEALIKEVISQDTSNQDNVTVIILARINDDEPQTILYQPPLLDNKKRLYMIIGGLLVILLIGLFAYFSMGNEYKEDSDKNTSQTNIPKKQKDKPEEVIPAKSVGTNEDTGSSTVPGQTKSKVETNRSFEQRSLEDNDSKDSDSAKRISRTEPEKSIEVKPEKATARKQKSQNISIQMQDMSPEDIKKSNNPHETSKKPNNKKEPEILDAF